MSIGKRKLMELLTILRVSDHMTSDEKHLVIKEAMKEITDTSKVNEYVLLGLLKKMKEDEPETVDLSGKMKTLCREQLDFPELNEYFNKYNDSPTDETMREINKSIDNRMILAAQDLARAKCVIDKLEKSKQVLNEMEEKNDIRKDIGRTTELMNILKNLL